MSMISQQTAIDIAYAYREVETAEKLLSEITDEFDRRTVPDIRDAFGRRQDGLQLGVPSGNSGHRLFNVPWSICRPIIELHIQRQRTQITILTQKAQEEIAGVVTEGGAA
jgi:hypothetical protein